MALNRHFGNLYQEHKVLFTAILVGLFLLELEIFAIAAIRSGWEHTLVIFDADGQTVYEAIGRDMDSFNPEEFEKIFGPLDNYDVKRVSRDVPFPFRAWFVAAVGLPVGGILIFAFIVRAFSAVFLGDSRRHFSGDGEREKDADASSHENRLYDILDRMGRLNIFTIGFFIFLGVIGYWIVPNAAVYLGRVSIETILRYRWFFLGGVLVVLAIFVWIVYLRFRLAKKHIESRTDLEKYRLELEYRQAGNFPRQLSGPDVADLKPLLPPGASSEDGPGYRRFGNK